MCRNVCERTSVAVSIRVIMSTMVTVW